MKPEELEEVVLAIHAFSLAQAGTIAAHRATIDALIGAIGMGLPPLLSAISDNLDGLQNALRSEFERESLTAFDNTVSSIQDRLRTMRG